jgi:hypothetical protein
MRLQLIQSTQKKESPTVPKPSVAQRNLQEFQTPGRFKDSTDKQWQYPDYNASFAS